MSTDLTWLTTQSGAAAESALSASVHSDAVEEFRQSISGLWADQCARDMGVRYFSPIAKCHASATDGLLQQRSCLSDTQARLGEAHHDGVACNAHSGDVEKLINDCSGQGKLLEGLASEVDGLLAEAERLAAEAEDLCETADTAGDSAVPEHLYCD
jgi:hypothetical protein